MKEKFKRKKLTKIISLTLTLAMVLTMMPWMSVPVRAAGEDFIAATATSAYTPTVIHNGDFEVEPWMNYKIGDTTYTKDNLPSNKPDKVTVVAIPNSTDGGWNTSDRTVQGGTLFEHLGGLATWHNNELNNNMHGYCVEMNAANAAVLYQDLTTYPGDIIQWTLNHGFRTIGGTADIQSIKVEIGKPNGTPEGVNAKIANNSTMAIYSATASALGKYGYVKAGDLTGLSISKNDDTGVWHPAQGVYIVPAGQTVTRFAFVSENTEHPDMGNYLDDVTFSTLVGNLRATTQDNGDVIVTGYWGDTGDKHLEVKIGDEIKTVDMSDVPKGNFSITIPKATIGDNTSVNIYHEDYPTATESVKIMHGSHNWVYEAGTGDNANKLIAKCTKDGECPIKNAKTGLPLTLSASSPAHEDTSKEPIITYGTTKEQQVWTDAGLTIPGTVEPPHITKTYYEADELGNKKDGTGSSTAPEATGKYIVDVTVDYGSGNTNTFSLPYRVKKPLGEQANTDDTAVSGGKGTVTVTGMKEGQEYIVSDTNLTAPITDDQWNSGISVGSNGVVTGLEDGKTYYVYTRKKDTPEKEPGEVVFVGSCITELKDNKTGYTINADGTIKIDEDYEVFKNDIFTDGVSDGDPLVEGITYYVRKKAKDGAGPSDAVPFKYKPASAPTGLDSENPQCAGGDDGKITGLDPAVEYQYQIDGEDNWRDVPQGETEITGLRAGKVKVRIKGSTPNNAGPFTEITIDDGKLPEELNKTKVEPENGGSSYKLTGVTDDMQYSIDGGESWINVPDSATEVSGIPVGTEVLVRMINGNPNDILVLTAGTRPSYNNDGGGHVHEFEWGNWNRVTKDENGTMVYQCKLCGYVLEKEYIPAYAYTCLVESEHVLKTPQNGSVICEMGRWNAYPRWFFEKLATRPDVNITLKFLYQHKQYTVYIPAGTKIDTELDWYGPMKICSLYQFEVK